MNVFAFILTCLNGDFTIKSIVGLLTKEYNICWGLGENVNHKIWKIVSLLLLVFASVDSGSGLFYKNCLVVFEKERGV